MMRLYKAVTGKAGIGCGSLLLLLLLLSSPMTNAQQQRFDSDDLPAENEYRGGLEEVVVVGQAPEWRKSPASEERWRPDKFKLQTLDKPSRLQWFPEYSKDERDNYQGVRDRKGEKAEFQLFNWKF
jgi:hypothetical protein